MTFESQVSRGELDPARPAIVLPRRTLIVAVGGLLLTLMLAALDSTIVATAMPRIVADLNGFSQYTWVTIAYLLTSTISVPLVGKLVDQYGRRLFLISGTLIFIAASVLCAVAATFDQLVAFRLIQGLGGGMLTASVFAAVPTLFAPLDRPRIVGLFTGTYGLSSIVGPLLGGIITDSIGWRWVFMVNLPLGLVALGLVLATYPDDRPQLVGGGRTAVDLPGAALLVGAATPILLALTLGGREVAWRSPQMAALLGVAAVCAVGFIRAEQRAPDPMVPLGLLRSRTVGIPLLSTLLMSAGFFAALLFTPLFVQGVIGRTATQSGGVLAPMMLAWVLASVIVGQLIARAGRTRLSGLVGMLVGGLGLALMGGMGADTDYAVVVRNLVVVGFGLGAALPAFAIAVQNAVPLRQTGIATALSTFTRALGNTLASAALGGVFAALVGGSASASVAPEVLDSALSATFRVAAVVVWIGAGVTLLLREAPLRPRGRAGRETRERQTGPVREVSSVGVS